MSMIRNSYLILDLASAPLADAADYLDPVSPPSNYRDPAKIEIYQAEKQKERLQGAALDLDLARISAVGYMTHASSSVEWIANMEFLPEQFPEPRTAECHILRALGTLCADTTIITYGGNRFDLPLLMRRARYLNVPFPALNLDRYRSPHVDLLDLLSDRDPQRRRPLGFYVKRLGWTDLSKPLSGAEEAQIYESGRWAELEQSIRHDVTAIQRLATWLGVIS